MIATANAFKILGCTPKFIDVNPTDYYLNPELIEAAISEKTKAIVVMNANGRYPLGGMEPYLAIAKKYGLKLIEDAAQSLGSYYPDGKHIGNHSNLSTFSFSAPKIISTGQGGMVCTNDDELAHKISRLKDFGRASSGTDVHYSIGYNFKFTDLQAVIGLEQLKKLEARVQRKKELYNLYQKHLSKNKKAKLVFNDVQFTSPWFFEIMVQDRQKLIDNLATHNIGSRPMYPPINKQLAYNQDEQLLISDEIGSKGLWLPSQVQLKNRQIEHICEVLNNFFNKG
jgi:perosamine synthetase